MKENKYDEKDFFEEYGKMNRSVGGLVAAGEWHAFKKLLPGFTRKAVLDLGCGYGWHCRYAVEQGASAVIGVDLSERMLAEAQARTNDSRISYLRGAIEDIEFQPESFDLIISSLSFHYVESLETVIANLYRMLKPKGDLVFSVEHPIFTASGNQDWAYDENGAKLHWPIDRYFSEGKREAIFLGHTVIKFHRTLTTYLGLLITCGFSIRSVVEPQPFQDMLDDNEGFQDELRRPMMLLVAAQKP